MKRCFGLWTLLFLASRFQVARSQDVLDCPQTAWKYASNGNVEQTVDVIHIGFGIDETCAVAGTYNVTRMTWSIIPAPEGTTTTYVGSIPQDLIKAVPVVKNFGAELYFQPGPAAVNYTGEAGVIISVPRDQLRDIYIPNEVAKDSVAHKVQVSDGFTSLSRIWAGSALSEYEDFVTGQGIMLRVKHTTGDEPLNDLYLWGVGMDVEAEVASVTNVNIWALNSNIKLKGNALSEMEFKGGSSYDCVEGCGTTILFEGNAYFQINAQAHVGAPPDKTVDSRLEIKVNDLAFSCKDHFRVTQGEDRDITCQRTDETVDVSYFNCLTTPATDWDLLECTDEAETCSCQVPVRQITPTTESPTFAPTSSEASFLPVVFSLIVASALSFAL